MFFFSTQATWPPNGDRRLEKEFIFLFFILSPFPALASWRDSRGHTDSELFFLYLTRCIVTVPTTVRNAVKNSFRFLWVQEGLLTLGCLTIIFLFDKVVHFFTPLPPPDHPRGKPQNRKMSQFYGVLQNVQTCRQVYRWIFNIYSREISLSCKYISGIKKTICQHLHI